MAARNAMMKSVDNFFKCFSKTYRRSIQGGKLSGLSNAWKSQQQAYSTSNYQGVRPSLTARRHLHCCRLQGRMFLSRPVNTRVSFYAAWVTVRNFSISTAKRCSSDSTGRSELGKVDADKMQIVFTCNVCQERSSRIISKLAYSKGVIIIRCFGCNNNHLIADNLGWFFDEKKNIEDIIAEKGGQVLRMAGEEMQFVPEENTETSVEEDHKTS